MQCPSDVAALGLPRLALLHEHKFAAVRGRFHSLPTIHSQHFMHVSSAVNMLCVNSRPSLSTLGCQLRLRRGLKPVAFAASTCAASQRSSAHSHLSSVCGDGVASPVRELRRGCKHSQTQDDDAPAAQAN